MIEKPLVLLLLLPALALMRRFSFFRLSRLAVFGLLLIALASPYTIKESQSYGEPVVSILLDSTGSMEVFGDLALKDETVASLLVGNTTSLGDAVLNLLQKGGNIVLYTDGNNNAGRNLLDVAALAARLDVKLYAVPPALNSSEVWMRIEGPMEVSLGEEAVTEVVVRKLGDEASYRLVVYVDGAEALAQEVIQAAEEERFTLRLQFTAPGSHRVRAVITPSSLDRFPENNEFYRAIAVLPRPRVLFISDKPSPLQEALKAGYEVVSSREGKYDAVVMNNLPLSSLSKEEVELLGSYVREGGGLVVIGGDNSYDQGGYRGSLFESYLPVRAGKTRLTGEDLALVMAIDISGSTESLFGGYTKVDVEKAIAIGLIRTLRREYSLGVLAFNQNAYVIANLSRGHDRQELEEKIARLQFGGGTLVLSAQVAADDMLRAFPGSKNLVVISDGITNLPRASHDKALVMRGRGVKTFTVGVGYDADSEFLGSLAASGGGVYFPQEEEGRLRLVFGEPEEEGIFSLKVLDTNHFITREQEVFGSITGFNAVSPKDSARTLVTTGSGDAVLAVWRFGLGRVASLATDDGEKWASQLYMGGNARLLTRTLNWALVQRRDGYIRALDTRVGEPLVVTASSQLNLSIDGEPLLLENVAPLDYRASYQPEKSGFYTVEGGGIERIVAVNYPRELAQLGVNPDLQAVVEATGGRIIESAGFEEVVRSEALERTRRVIYEKEDKSSIFVLAAMLLFFGEVAHRRLREVRGKRSS